MMDIKDKRDSIISKNSLIPMAHNLIIHYLESIPLPDEEIKRVKQVLNTTPIEIENSVPGSHVLGNTDGNKIRLFFYDINNITNEEWINAISTLVHEYYHLISKENQKSHALKKYDHKFLEEGYVSLMSSKTIRHAIDNPFEFESASKKDVASILEKTNLKNGYENESEFVRSTQLIMSQYGYDSALIYMFSENGIEKLNEIAKKISPEFGEIMRRQTLKEHTANNCEYEKKFFRNQLSQINPDSFSETDIEMNFLLAKQLIDSGIASKNQRLREIINRQHNGLEIRSSFVHYLEKLSPEEISEAIKSELEKVNFEYEPQGNRFKDVSRMFEIVRNEYNDSKVRIWNLFRFQTFGTMIAYDLYKRGIQNPKDDEIKDYLKYCCDIEDDEKIFLREVKLAMNNVKNGIDNGKSLCNILNEKLLQVYSELIPMYSIYDNTNQDNFWENAEKLGKIVSKQNDENGEMQFYTFYSILNLMMEKAIVPDKIYKKDDYEDFMKKMTKIFEDANVPIEFMKTIGLTPARLFFEKVSEKVNPKERRNQMVELLGIAQSRIDLGSGYHNMLQDFVFNIYAVYEDVKASGDKELLNQYRYVILKAFESSLNNPTSYLIKTQRFIVSIDSKYYRTILDDIILDEDIYKNPQTGIFLFEANSSISAKARCSYKLGSMILKQLPKDVQERFASMKNVTFNTILKELFGRDNIKLDEIPQDKLDSLGDIAKFLLAYQEYYWIYGKKEKDDFWSRIYPVENEKGEEGTGVAANIKPSAGNTPQGLDR